MKIILVAGFLGSGKTTTILNLARYLTADPDVRLAVLVNEAGAIPMDGAVLTEAGNKVKEIFAGCLCCQVAGSLITAVRELADTADLDYLIIEPSGLADPARIHMLLPRAGHKAWRSLYIVDVPRFQLLMQAARPVIQSGILSADTVLANKADLGSEELMMQVAATVAEIDEAVEVVAISAQNGIDPAVWWQVIGND